MDHAHEHHEVTIELNTVSNPDRLQQSDRKFRAFTIDPDTLEQMLDENNDASSKFDLVILFDNYPPPTHKKDKSASELETPSTPGKKHAERLAAHSTIHQARHDLVRKLKSVGFRIMKKEGTDRNSLYLLMTCDMERLEDQAEKIGLHLNLKSKHGGGHAPFEVAHRDMFTEEIEGGHLRKVQKFYLMQSIMEDDDGIDLKLAELISDGVISRMYPLHEKKKLKDLLDNWSLPRNLLRDQPIDRIRDYFGEEITIYFAWLGFYTQWLWYASAFGFLVTFFWAVTYFDSDAQWTLWSVTIYCVYLALWSTGFLEFWKRYNNTLSYQWGMEDYHNQEQQRDSFKGEIGSGVWVDGIWIPFDPNNKYKIQPPKGSKYYSVQKRRAKFITQGPLVAMMMALVVVLTVSVLSFRLFVQNVEATLGSVVGGVANAIVIMFMNTVWKMVAVKLNDWENHRTESEYENSLIIKIFAFYFVNSYTSLFYIAFFKGSGRMFGASALKDACKSGRTDIVNIGSGCMDELTIQLVTILMVNMIVGQSREVAIPWMMGKMKIFMLKRAHKNMSAEEVEKDLTGVTKIPHWEEESKRPPFPGTFDEYSEMVIQYGYITMFAASFPLAPFLAVINNVIEIRTDAFKLLEAHSRPFYRGAKGIGAWYDILNFIGVISVITNCLLIGYSLNSVAIIFGGVPENPFARRISQTPYNTLIVIVIIEHILFALKAGLAYVIPDVPGEIVKDRARQNWIKEMTLKTFRVVEKKDWSVQDEDENMLFQ